MRDVFRKLLIFLDMTIESNKSNAIDIEKIPIAKLEDLKKMLKKHIDNNDGGSVFDVDVYNGIIDRIRSIKDSLVDTDGKAKEGSIGTWPFNKKITCKLPGEIDGLVMQAGEIRDKYVMQAKNEADADAAKAKVDQASQEEMIRKVVAEQYKKQLEEQRQKDFQKLADILSTEKDPEQMKAKLYKAIGWKGDEKASTAGMFSYSELKDPAEKLKRCLGEKHYQALMALAAFRNQPDNLPIEKAMAKLMCFWIMKGARQQTVDTIIAHANSKINEMKMEAPVPLSDAFVQLHTNISKNYSDVDFAIKPGFTKEELKICCSAIKKNDQEEGLLPSDVGARNYFNTLLEQKILPPGQEWDAKKNKHLDENTYLSYFLSEINKAISSPSSRLTSSGLVI